MEGKSNSKDRLLLFLSEKGISKNKCEEMCGWSKGYLSILKGDFGSEKLAALMRVFSDLNILWLISGEGEHYTTPKEEPKELKEEVVKQGSVISFDEFLQAMARKDAEISELHRKIGILENQLGKENGKSD